MPAFEWISADTAPDNWYEPVLYKTENGKLGVLKNTVGWYGGNSKDKSQHHSEWDWLREKYNITFWVYQKYLLWTI